MPWNTSHWAPITLQSQTQPYVGNLAWRSGRAIEAINQHCNRRASDSSANFDADFGRDHERPQCYPSCR